MSRLRAIVTVGGMGDERDDECRRDEECNHTTGAEVGFHASSMLAAAPVVKPSYEVCFLASTSISILILSPTTTPPESSVLFHEMPKS